MPAAVPRSLAAEPRACPRGVRGGARPSGGLSEPLGWGPGHTASCRPTCPRRHLPYEEEEPHKPFRF